MVKQKNRSFDCHVTTTLIHLISIIEVLKQLKGPNFTENC